jgi:hypothetical protein
MRNVMGLVLFGFGAWLAFSAYAHRAGVIAARRGGPTPVEGEAPGNPQLAVFGEIMRPIILFALGLLAVKTIFAYLVLDGNRWVSLVDLAGFLFLLAAYGSWVAVKTKYRPVWSVVPARAAVATPEEAVPDGGRPEKDRVPKMAA